MQEFDLEFLAQFNGKEGQPAYVAYKGKVYDVSLSRMWKTGQHMKRHAAGRDLTQDILAAPHGTEKLDIYPQVGILKETVSPEQTLPAFLHELLARVPFLQRHPHPSLVHFPVAFLMAPTLFNILFLITGVPAFETTAFHCLGAGIFFALPAIASGYFTWWINYQARAMRPVRIKIGLSWLLIVIAIPAFSVRLLDPAILCTLSTTGIGYLLATLVLAPMVGTIGWFGGGLTFPLEKRTVSRR